MYTSDICAERMPSFQWTALLTNNYFICNNKNINYRFRSARHPFFTLTPILFKQLTFITATSGFVVDKQEYGSVTISIILNTEMGNETYILDKESGRKKIEIQSSLLTLPFR